MEDLDNREIPDSDAEKDSRGENERTTPISGTNPQEGYGDPAFGYREEGQSSSGGYFYGGEAFREKEREEFSSGPGLPSAMKYYFLVFLLLLTLGSLLQGWNFETGMLVTQWVIILLPGLWFWKRFRVNRFSFSRLRPLSFRFIPTILLLTVSFWLLNLLLSSGLMEALIRWGYQPVELLPPPQDFSDYLVYLFLIAVSAGICEEVFFRGTIMPALEERGIIPALVFSSLLFAVFHLSFLRLGSTFLLGLVMGVIVIKTGSLWGGVLYHAFNNFLGVTYLYLANHLEQIDQVEAVQSQPQAELDGIWVGLPLLFLSLAGGIYGFKVLHRQSGTAPLWPPPEGLLPRGWFNRLFAVSLVLFLIVAFLELAMGFDWWGELAIIIL